MSHRGFGIIRNRQLPSSEEQLMKKLHLCYIGPLAGTKVNNNNTDVYKRQHVVVCELCWSKRGIAVSYTHLDVYKRQI